MRITDPEVIRNGEKDLLKAIEEDLDLDMVKEILKEQLAASSLNSSGGEIVVHDNQIAFKLDFTIQLSGSLMFDREGNYISGTTKEAREDSQTDSGGSSQEYPEDLDPEDLDLNDLDIREALVEAAPQLSSDAGEPKEPEKSENPEKLETLEDTDDLDSEDEELDIKLPDYNLDEELDEEEDNEENQLPDMPEPLDMPDDVLQDDGEEEDLIDDDISDILKESREFWDQKKDS